MARILAVLLAVIVCLLPAAADARTQTLNVHFYDSATGTKVEIKDMQGNTLGSGTVGADGNASITFEVPDGVDKVLIDTDAGSAQGRSAFLVLDLRNAGQGMEVFMSTYSNSATGAELADLAKSAIAKCDKAAYDRWVDELNRWIANVEVALVLAQQDADADARRNNLRITDLAGARKDLQRTAKAQEKLDPAIRNPAVLAALVRYIDLLERVEQVKRDLDEARRARDAMPPFPEDCKKDKFGLLPGGKTCPDGSGGLLAGVLNEVFDADLDPSCDDGSQRRDTERKKKDRHGGERKD